MSDENKIVRRLNDNTIEVSMPSKLGYERIAMESSASFAKIIGFMKDRIEDLKTAVSEACLNAMEHGNKGLDDARVVVTMSFENGILSVAVKDEGTGIGAFPEEPDIEKKVQNLEPTNGLGVYLIRKLVDQVEFNNVTSEGHVVTMQMKLSD